MKLEDLQPNAAVRGLLTGGTATVVIVQCHGADALTLIFRRRSGPCRRGDPEPIRIPAHGELQSCGCVWTDSETRLDSVSTMRPDDFTPCGARISTDISVRDSAACMHGLEILRPRTSDHA
jgi:hypothetical protein